MDKKRLLSKISRYDGKPLTLMEVCGSHTAAVFRTGIRNILPPSVRLISGPGCPVCVADDAFISRAAALEGRARLISFGDMARTVGRLRPGTRVETAASPTDAVMRAKAAPAEDVVFLSVGFETTNPVCALSVLRAREENVKNFFLLTCNKTMPPIMEYLAKAYPDTDGYLLPGHVCAVSGTGFYKEFCKKYNVKGCVAGFDSLQLSAALYLLMYGKTLFSNVYSYVKEEGSPSAEAAVREVFEPCPAVIRGIGEIPGAGLRLKKEFAAFDASCRFGLQEVFPPQDAGCRCGDVICGRIEPPECPLYGVSCRPETPCGPCMISSEGTCFAYFGGCERRSV